MSQPFFEIVGAVFPLLFLMVFGFVALIWSALLMIMFINTVRSLKEADSDSRNDDNDVSDVEQPSDSNPSPPSPSQPQKRPRPRKRDHVRPQANSRPGVAAEHSLPPYISNN